VVEIWSGAACGGGVGPTTLSPLASNFSSWLCASAATVWPVTLVLDEVLPTVWPM
jgi:hypothetical protein